MNTQRTHPRHAEIVAAIRSHPLIGRGTCSPIDECYTDDELVDRFGWGIHHYDPETFEPVRTRQNSVVAATAAAKAEHRLFVAVHNDRSGW
jgi:hypothetical protein